jgi:hypothetical protein
MVARAPRGSHNEGMRYSLVVLLAVAACSDGPPIGPVELVGNWPLVSVANGALPASVAPGTICSQVVSGFIDLESNGTYTAKIVYGPAPHCSAEWVSQGTYTKGDNSVTFTAGSNTHVADIAGRRLTRLIDSRTYAWEK